MSRVLSRTAVTAAPRSPGSAIDIVQTSEEVVIRDDIHYGDFHQPLPYYWYKEVRRGDRGGESYAVVPYPPFQLRRPVLRATTPVGALQVPRVYDQTAYNNAVSKFYEKVRGTLDLSVDVAQAGSIVRMFRKTDQVLDIATKLTKRPKSGKEIFERSARGTRDLAQAWLEASYGWKPLLGSIYGATDATQDRVLGVVSQVKGSYYRRENRDVTMTWQSPGLYGNNVPVKTRHHMKRRVMIQAFTDISKVSKTSIWTSMNPVSIAWELVPYSFVVDWFLDIGSYLRNLESHLLYQGLPLRKGYVSRYEIDIYQTYRNWTVRSGGGDQVVISRGGLMYSAEMYDRQTLNQVPFPQYPKFTTGDLGTNRLWSAAALLRVLLRK